GVPGRAGEPGGGRGEAGAGRAGRLGGVVRRRPGPWTRRNRRAALVFLAPLLLVVGTLVLIPIVQTTWTSLYSEDGSRFVGLANYVDLLTSAQTRKAISNNLVWVVVAPTVVTVLGLLFAVLTDRIRQATAFRLVLFMPMAISFLAAGVTFRLVYDEDPSRGMLNAAIVAVHDSFARPSPYPGATVRDGSGLRVSDGAILTGEVAAGDVVLLPLVAVAPDAVPDHATEAVAPPPGPGVRGMVWRDFAPEGTGRAGQADPGERGLPGVAVEVLRDGEVVARTLTDARGWFSVPDLVGGGYAVRLAAANFTPPYQGLTWLGPGLVTPAIMGSYVWVWAGFAMVVISAGLG